MVLNLLVGHDDGTVIPYYGIEHEKKLWLVTLDRPAKKCDPGDEFDYVIQLLPRAVIEGVSQDTPGFEVRSLPDSPVVHRRDLKTLPILFS